MCQKTVSYKNLFKKFKSNTDQQSWTFGKNALKLNEKIINFTFLCQKRQVTRICLRILKSKTDQQSIHFTYSAVLTHGQEVARGSHANICMLCTACFCFMFKHWFSWKYQYNKCMFNSIDIYSFIPVSGCVGMGPSAILCCQDDPALT